MNTSLTVLFAMLVGWNGSALADSTALFESSTRGRVILNNGKTADGDFLWDILAVEPSTAGLKQMKTFATVHGDFKVICNRINTPQKPFTSCTLTFAVVPSGGAVSISKGENQITGVFSDEVSGRFHLSEELMKSPDGALTVCSVCGQAGTGLEFSLTWKK